MKSPVFLFFFGYYRLFIGSLTGCDPKQQTGPDPVFLCESVSELILQFQTCVGIIHSEKHMIHAGPLALQAAIIV